MYFTLFYIQQVPNQMPIPAPEVDTMSSGMASGMAPGMAPGMAESMEPNYPKYEENMNRVRGLLRESVGWGWMFIPVSINISVE